MLNIYIEEIKKIVLSAQLLEVYASPKPGLVDKTDNGAHTDMNINTFVDSARAINSTFSKCFEIGYLYNEKPPNEILRKLRKIGINGENKMLEATNGINTHKGQLFLLGLMSAAVGILVSKGKLVNIKEISNTIKILSKNIVNNELKSTKNDNSTHGEIIYNKFGIKGIRGEVEAGIPSINSLGYIKFKELLFKGIGLNNALIGTLIELMAKVDDTNVLWRSGIKGSVYVKEMANNALSLGSVTTKQGMNYIKEMNLEFSKKNISPGGCADMLSAISMIYLIEKNELFKNGGYYGLQQTSVRYAQKI